MRVNRVDRIVLRALACAAFNIVACSAPSSTPQGYGNPSNGGNAGNGATGALGGASGTGQGGATGGAGGDGGTSGTGGSGGSGGASGTAVTGPMSMTLTKSEQGEFLEVSDGLIDGSALIFVTFRATISGRLDCTRARFTGALKNGTYGFLIFPGGSFEGPFNSQYDRPNTAFVGGTWQLAVANPPGGSCDGTWTANYVGP